MDTLRSVNLGAEKWLEQPVPCLDHGFVRLVDYMGDDAAIIQAARVSYGKGTKKVSEDRGLIRYLMRHAHTTPFEMCELKFHCKLPIFVARQWIRHRTANVNEYSGRYSVMSDDFYLPEPSALKKQSKNNRQGRGEGLTDEQKTEVLELLKADYESQRSRYKKFLEMDLARELARIGLSVANYTEWYWKIDLYNLLHFLRLRMDSHAQHEIQVYGNVMGQIVKDAFPIVWEAFEDYRLNAITLTGLEVGILKEVQWSMFHMWVPFKEYCYQRMSKREAEEFFDKLRKLNFISW